MKHRKPLPFDRNWGGSFFIPIQAVPQHRLSNRMHPCEPEPSPHPPLSLRGRRPHPRVASLAPAGQFTFWQSPGIRWRQVGNRRKAQFPCPPRIYEGGARRAGGSPAALRIRRRVTINGTPYRILPPVRRCAWTSPLINEGGKRVRRSTLVRWFSQHSTRRFSRFAQNDILFGTFRTRLSVGGRRGLLRKAVAFFRVSCETI